MIFLFFFCHPLITSKLFIALGNDRPRNLVSLEDQVLQAIIGLSEGKSREHIMDGLYSQIKAMETDLSDDNHAMTWFNSTKPSVSIPSTPLPSEFPSTPLPGSQI